MDATLQGGMLSNQVAHFSLRKWLTFRCVLPFATPRLRLPGFDNPARAGYGMNYGAIKNFYSESFLVWPHRLAA